MAGWDDFTEGEGAGGFSGHQAWGLGPGGFTHPPAANQQAPSTMQVHQLPYQAWAPVQQQEPAALGAWGPKAATAGSSWGQSMGPAASWTAPGASAWTQTQSVQQQQQPLSPAPVCVPWAQHAPMQQEPVHEGWGGPWGSSSSRPREEGVATWGLAAGGLSHVQSGAAHAAFAEKGARATQQQPLQPQQPQQAWGPSVLQPSPAPTPAIGAHRKPPSGKKGGQSLLTNFFSQQAGDSTQRLAAARGAAAGMPADKPAADEEGSSDMQIDTAQGAPESSKRKAGAMAAAAEDDGLALAAGSKKAACVKRGAKAPVDKAAKKESREAAAAAKKSAKLVQELEAAAEECGEELGWEQVQGEVGWAPGLVDVWG